MCSVDVIKAPLFLYSWIWSCWICDWPAVLFTPTSLVYFWSIFLTSCGVRCWRWKLCLRTTTTFCDAFLLLTLVLTQRLGQSTECMNLEQFLLPNLKLITSFYHYLPVNRYFVYTVMFFGLPLNPVWNPMFLELWRLDCCIGCLNVCTVCLLFCNMIISALQKISLEKV